MKALYYSSETPSIEKRYKIYLDFEDKITQIFIKNKFPFYKLSKPEIYKHPIALEFLNNFSIGSTHLIVRLPHNIRILKGAVNIVILPIALTRQELENNQNPFKSYRRMFSIVDEVWTTHKDNLVLFEKEDAVTMKYLNDESELMANITALS